MTDRTAHNQGFFARWHKNTPATKNAIEAGMAEKKPYHEDNPLSPRMQRDIGLMGGMFSTAMGRRS
ncbi:hypothetical protein [Maritalea sp. S77]|uniref:hypothetical protein n=1 Tax=Maritalea sp. S77 TaxID=3415125 RepID=UPI003C7BE48C